MVPAAPLRRLPPLLLESLAQQLSRPAEQWLLLDGADCIPQGALPQTALQLGRQGMSLRGHWQGHVCQPALQEQSLDGLVLIQRDENLLHSWPGTWLDCLRVGGRLTLVCIGQRRQARRLWLRRLQAGRQLRCIEAMLYRQRGTQWQSRELPAPLPWSAHWSLSRASAARIEFLHDGSSAAPLTRRVAQRKAVAMPIQGVSRV